MKERTETEVLLEAGATIATDEDMHSRGTDRKIEPDCPSLRKTYEEATKDDWNEDMERNEELMNITTPDTELKCTGDLECKIHDHRPAPPAIEINTPDTEDWGCRRTLIADACIVKKEDYITEKDTIDSATFQFHTPDTELRDAVEDIVRRIETLETDYSDGTYVSTSDAKKIGNDIQNLLSSRDTYWKERVRKEVEGMKKQVYFPDEYKNENPNFLKALETEQRKNDTWNQALDTLLDNLK